MIDHDGPFFEATPLIIMEPRGTAQPSGTDRVGRLLRVRSPKVTFKLPAVNLWCT